MTPWHLLLAASVLSLERSWLFLKLDSSIYIKLGIGLLVFAVIGVEIVLILSGKYVFTQSAIPEQGVHCLFKISHMFFHNVL